MTELTFLALAGGATVLALLYGLVRCAAWLARRAEARRMRARVLARLQATQKDPDAWRGWREAEERRVRQ